jgi:hypothetical protein
MLPLNISRAGHLYSCRSLHSPKSTLDIKEHCSAGISIRAYSLLVPGSLVFLGYPGMIGDIVFIIAPVFEPGRNLRQSSFTLKRVWEQIVHNAL